MKQTIITCFLFLSVIHISAQPRCSFTHYSSEDGLSQKTVMSILEDRKGYMWFATWDGINKFNGYSFKTYKAGDGNSVGFTNNRVDHISEDRFGYLWILTYDNRAHRFDPRTEQFRQVPSSGEESQLYISSIEVLEEGSVWLITEQEGALRIIPGESQEEIPVEIYSVKSGLLPARMVNAVFMDSDKNEWLLTDNGLAKIYPGEVRPVVYFTETQASAPGYTQGFYSWMEEEEYIWFGSTKGRIWKYNKKEDTFELKELLAESNVVAIHTLLDKGILAATSNDGFLIFDREGKIRQYNSRTRPDMPGDNILNVYVDSHKEVWLDIDGIQGVSHFNPFTNRIKHEILLTEPGNAFRSQPYFHIHEDVHGNLWVHPYGGGFSWYDRKEDCLKPFYNEPGADNWRFSNKVHAAISDKDGNLWMCTHSKGLEKISFLSEQFRMYTPESLPYESIINDVRMLYEDTKGRLWMGTRDGKIRLYASDRTYLGYLDHNGTITKTVPPTTGVAYHVMQDSKGRYWISTKGEGLWMAEEVNGTFNITRHVHDSGNIYSLSDNNIYCTYEDKNGRIWVATFGGGLNYIREEETIHFIHHRNHLKEWPIEYCYRVRFVTSDHSGKVWVGTTSGAVCFNPDFENPSTLKFQRFHHESGKEHTLGNNDVHFILPATDGNIYLGTFGGGLNKIDSYMEDGEPRFKRYTTKNGLPSDAILAMQEDTQGNIWITTENGLCKFIPREERTDNYLTESMDFQAGFNEATLEYTQDGHMIFGTSNGVVDFIPDSIHKRSFVPPVMITRFLIANEEQAPGHSSVLQYIPDETSSITLTHKQNIFTLQFAGLDMRAPEKIQYAYILEGFEKEWSFVDKQRAVTYTNLPKGEYLFKVRSTNSDGVWVDNVREMNIRILPSFWETPWAVLLYIALILLVIWVAVYILFTIYRLKHKVVVEQQISDIKLRFFTNISHELRTPLTLIAGPVEHVLTNTPLTPEAREQLTLVKRNTGRMLNLINQILDFRKIQNKKMKMKVRHIELISFVKNIMGNFDSMALEHKIDFVLETDRKEVMVWADTDKLEKIIFNLLSNAFKYTPREKMIRVLVWQEDQSVFLGVQDQGVGIPENKKESIFVRFENLMDRNLFDQSSTGIGLALVKELVELHKARIKVDSTVGEGSIFTVEFKQGKSHFDPSTEFILEDYPEETSPIPFPDEEYKLHSREIEETAASDMKKELMLIIEDNNELRSFLHSIFASSFRLAEASNGTEGIEKATQLLPDIIISDIMMPGMNGMEVLKSLRDNFATCHIPIVLLTAKSSIESKLEGMEQGADDYITKPFSSSYLQARVGNLLKQRRNLQRIYRSGLMPAISGSEIEKHTTKEKEPEMSKSDRKFMDKLMSLMDQHMDNGELMVDDLVGELAVSRSVFFKKLKALTGLAPVEFIKEIRIKRAAQLIETGEYNMTQVSFMVGINDSRYFSKCFKQFYGMTPTEYKEQKIHSSGQFMHTG